MEALIGVLIGGVIGYVAAITTLVVEHRRWRKEFKLHYLITERLRREKQCDRLRKLMEEGLLKDSYSVELVIGLRTRLPLKTTDLIDKALKDIDYSQPEGKRKIHHKISFILGNYLGEIDKQIEELTQ